MFWQSLISPLSEDFFGPGKIKGSARNKTRKVFIETKVPTRKILDGE